MHRHTTVFHNTPKPEFRRNQSVRVRRSAWPTLQIHVQSYVPKRSFLRTLAPTPRSGY